RNEMRVRHVIPFAHKLIVPDHWDLPFQGGICRLVEEDGIIEALEVIFPGQPIDLAPKITQSEFKNAHEIKIEDTTLQFAKIQIEDAIAFLKAQFNVELDWNTTETFFESEADAEKDDIHIKNFKTERHTPPSPI